MISDNLSGEVMSKAQQAIINSIDSRSIATVQSSESTRGELYAWCRTSEPVNESDMFYFGPAVSDGGSLWVVLAEGEE